MTIAFYRQLTLGGQQGIRAAKVFYLLTKKSLSLCSSRVGGEKNDCLAQQQVRESKTLGLLSHPSVSFDHL